MFCINMKNFASEKYPANSQNGGTYSYNKISDVELYSKNTFRIL